MDTSFRGPIFRILMLAGAQQLKQGCFCFCFFVFFVCLFVFFKVTMQGFGARVSCSGSAMRQVTDEYRQFSMILSKIPLWEPM